MQTHRFTNLKCPDPSFLHPASQSAPHLSVSLCSYFFLKNKRIPAVLLPFLEEIAPSVPSVPSLIFIYPLFVQPSGVLSLLFSWIFFLCFLQFLSFKLLRKIFVNLKIYVLDYWLLFLVSGSLCFGLFVWKSENLKIFLSVFRALCVSGWVLCFFSCFFNCCGS